MKYKSSIKKMRLRIAEIKPVWTKYFAPPSDEGKDRKDDDGGKNNGSKEAEEGSDEKEK